jgi:enediyne biosynthesis protein E4
VRILPPRSAVVRAGLKTCPYVLSAGLVAVLLVTSSGSATRALATAAQDPDRARQQSRMIHVQQEAVALLKRAAASPAGGAEWKQSLLDAAERFEALGPLLPQDLVQELRKSARTLRTRARGRQPSTVPFSAESFLELLERVGAALGPDPLAFQGSYSQTRVAGPAYGGHSSAMGPPPTDPRAGGSAAKIASPVQFQEVPRISTKTFCGGRTKDHILESGGSGVALVDYDGDGWLDVYLVTAFELSDRREKIPHRNALFRNLGDWTFQDVSAGSGLDAAAWGNGVCAGDYDDDGRLDLYVTNFGPNFLFRNAGDGTFADRAAAAGVQASGWSTGCTFFDPDGDGDLDLYVARYVSTNWNELQQARRTLTWRGGPQTMVGPKGMAGEADLFFENRGDGTFVEATEAHGLTDAAGAYGFGVVATDYNDDGWIDLYVANDTKPNFLYRNRGDGRFESVGLASGVALNAEGRAQAGMGVDSGDFDGDGRLDLIVTNFAHDTDTLYRNRDGQQFEDATAAVGLAGPTFVQMGWGTAFFDADLDGDLDLFFANGHIYPNVDDFPDLQETFRQKSQLFLNDRARFVDVSETAGGGLQRAASSRGLAVGDLDNDGDLDLVVSNMDDKPTLLENRQRTGHHWVALQLEKPGRNRFCIGARVTIDAGGTRQVREIRGGGSYLSQNDLRAHFGLGSYAGTVDVEVRMPGGATRRWERQPIDRVLRLKMEDARAK